MGRRQLSKHHSDDGPSLLGVCHRYDDVIVFAMIKERFGGGVLSRHPTARVNEVLAKCVAHNLRCVVKAIFISGLAPTFWADVPAGLVLVGGDDE